MISIISIIEILSVCFVAWFINTWGYREGYLKSVEFGTAQDKKKKIAEAEPVITTPPVFKSILWKMPIPLSNKNKHPKK